MANVLATVAKVFYYIFQAPVGGLGNQTLFARLINVITRHPYIYLGAVLIIIGFSIGIIKRIIHS